jgi:hypothetical protein
MEVSINDDMSLFEVFLAKSSHFNFGINVVNVGSYLSVIIYFRLIGSITWILFHRHKLNFYTIVFKN